MSSVRKKGCWETYPYTEAVPCWNIKSCVLICTPKCLCDQLCDSNLRTWAIHLETRKKMKECLGIQTVPLVLNYYPVIIWNHRRIISSMFLLTHVYIFIKWTADIFWIWKAPNVLQIFDMNHVVICIHKSHRCLSIVSKYLCIQTAKMGENH